MKKKYILSVVLGIGLAAVTLFVIQAVFFAPDLQVLEKSKIEGYNVYLYELDPGARGSKTVNISVGKLINLYKRGNVYCASMPEDSKTSFLIDEDLNVIVVSAKEEKMEIILRRDNFKDIKIIYN